LKNLNEELVKVLFELGITKIKHGHYIKNNVEVNKNKGDKNKTYSNYYNDDILKQVNDFFNIVKTSLPDSYKSVKEGKRVERFEFEY
jgi:hypothetical protein